MFYWNNSLLFSGDKALGIVILGSENRLFILTIFVGLSGLFVCLFVQSLTKSLFKSDFPNRYSSNNATIILHTAVFILKNV